VAIVTGGGRGIGAAIAAELAMGGARVVVVYHSNATAAEAVAEAIDGVAVQGDVADTSDCERIVAAAAELGEIAILVNNAGITRDTLVLRMKDEQFDDVLATNTGGTFRMCRAVLPAMAKRRDGVIVNIASVAAVRGNAAQVNYAASKGAVVALTKSLAKEMGRRNIRVNAVAPGFIATDMTAHLDERTVDNALQQIPLRRMGKPEEIAPMVRFLCGPGGAYVTGQLFIVDGGLSA